MKMLTHRLKWTAIVLLSILLIGLFSVYALLHTQWGLKQLSSYLSRGAYEMTMDSVSYSLRAPKQITLHALTVREKNTHAPLLSKANLTLNFTPSILWRIRLWDRLHIQQGELDLSLLLSEKHAITTSQLQLQNVKIIHRVDPSFILSGTKINGTITPFGQPHPHKIKPVTFAFTARHIHIADLTIDNAVLSGTAKKDRLILSNLGGNIGHGFFLSHGKRLSDGVWYIDELQFSHLRLENSGMMEVFTQLAPILPKVNFRSINLTDSSVNLPRLKIEKANLVLKKIRYDKRWRTEGVSMWFDADRVHWNDELFSDPELMLHIAADKMNIDRASSRWRKGFVSFTGSVQNRHWQLDKLVISGVQFILPDQGWLQLDSQWHFSENIADLTIAQFILNPSILIDPNPEFPMQFTALTAAAHTVELVRNHQFNIWQGEGHISADSASLNSIDIRYPELTLSTKSASADQSTVSSHLAFNMLIGKGLLEGTWQGTLSSKALDHLQITADEVSSQILTNWQIIQNPPTTKRFSLDLSGSYNPIDLNGKLTILGKSPPTTYSVQHNRIVP